MADWNPQANDIFLKALDIRSPEERLAFLDSACTGSAELRAQVESLLTASDQAGSFLESPAPALSATTNQSISEQPGTIIGPYKLLQQIGEGGMGVVYMAQQTEPVQRRVALKIIKPGMDSNKVIARFEAERQALALMDHPNIAKVLDAGATDSGRPYFVMELVKGVPITEYCDEKHLTVRQRLELLLPVCQAVQHAHQKGIIHRDIKPSNVMVALYDGRAVPKVIDFGVAKATGSRLTDKTVFTDFGQVIGTLEYMSPEQAELNQLDVDTRSDIYSLGVLLYELLTGTTPLDRKRLCAAAFDEMLRMIREEEPPKPSTRLSTTNEGASIAANRGLEPKKLSGLVHGELDWIVMKALEKDRSRRYETANGLATDISRYLADEAVQACPPSATYRFRKFARRNRVALTTGVLVSAALVLGTAVSTWQAIRAEAARAAEAEQRKVAESARTAEADQRTVAEEQRNEAERQRAQADANFEQARNAVDDYFNTVSESKLLDVPGLEPLRKELLESALKYYEGFVDQQGDDPGRLADLVVAHLRVMVILYSNGDGPDRWLPHMVQAIEILEPLVREGHDTPDVQRRMAGWFRSNTDPRNWQGNWQGGEEDRPALDRGLKRYAEIWEKFVRDNPSVPEFQSDLAGIYFYTGSNQIQGGKIADAARTGKRVLEISEKLTHDYPQEPRYRLDLARVYDAFGGLQTSNPLLKKEGQTYRQKALALREQVVKGFPQVAGYRTQLGLNYSAAAQACSPENRDEAEQLSSKALAQFENVAAAFPTMQSARIDLARECLRLGDVLARRGKQPDAIKLYRRSIGLWDGLTSEAPDQWKNRTNLAQTWLSLANALVKDGKPIEADDALRQATEISRLLAEDPSVSPQSRREQAWFYRQASEMLAARPGQMTAAADARRREMELWQQLAADHPTEPNYRAEIGHSLWQVANLSSSLGQHDEAEKSHRRALGVFEKLAVEFPKVAFYRQEQGFSCWLMGSLMKNRGRLHDAEELMRKALAIHAKLTADFPKEPEYRARLARGYSPLVEVLLPQGKQVEAAETLRQAVKTYEELAAQVSNDPNFRVELGHSLWQLANLSSTLGQNGEAEKAHRRALEVFEKLAAEFPTVAYYRQEQGISYWSVGTLMKNVGRPQDAEEPMRQALAIHVKLATDFPNEPLYRGRVPQSHGALIEVLLQQGKHAEVQETLRQAVKIFRELAGAHPEMPDFLKFQVDSLHRLALLQTSNKQVNEAEETDRQIEDASLRAIAQWEKLVENFPDVPAHRDGLARCHHDLAGLHQQRGQTDSAEKHYRQSVAIWIKLGEDVPAEPLFPHYAAYVLSFDLGPILETSGRTEEAEKSYRQAMAIHEKLLTDFPGHGNFSDFRSTFSHSCGSLFKLLKTAGRSQDAEEACDQAIAFYQILAAKFPDALQWPVEISSQHCLLGDLLRETARTEDAESAYRQAEQHYRQAIDVYELHPERKDLQGTRQSSLLGLAQLLAKIGRTDDAKETFNKAVESTPNEASALNEMAWMLATSPIEQFRHPGRAVEMATKANELAANAAHIINTLGIAHYRAGNWQDAIVWLMKSMELRNGGDSNDWFFLAMAHQQLGHKEEARKWLDQAVDWMEKHAPQNEELLHFRREAEDLLAGKPAVDANSKIRE